MPTYEYVCKACGHTFEVVRSIHDDPLTVCPDCGGELRKVFAPPAIAFKGSGFYATDHGKKAKKPSETKPSEKKPVETKGSETGSKDSGRSTPSETKASSSTGSGSGDGKPASS